MPGETTAALNGQPAERVLILGGTGMLGHKLWQVLSAHYETYATVRSPQVGWEALSIGERERWSTGVDATRPEHLLRVVGRVKPTLIINCIGIIKQRSAARDPIASIQVNALFPHQLYVLAQAVGAHLIHLSTDCVFSGKTGNYRESDLPDPPDLYGRSKLLGEIDAPGCLTLRTSIIGRELNSRYGLVEWFLSQAGGHVSGYANAIFSGVPTLVLASLIRDLLTRTPRLAGLYHVAAAPISKYDLLLLLRDAYGVSVQIDRDERYRCDRSLNGERFRAATGLTLPSWPEMTAAMAADSFAYADGR